MTSFSRTGGPARVAKTDMMTCSTTVDGWVWILIMQLWPGSCPQIFFTLTRLTLSHLLLISTFYESELGRKET